MCEINSREARVAARHRPQEEALVVEQTPAAAEEIAAEMAEGEAVVEAAAGRDKGEMTHADKEKPEVREVEMAL